ncbi:MAG: hypothetical protein ACK40L_05440 [Hydrogenophaga sp.]
MTLNSFTHNRKREMRHFAQPETIDESARPPRLLTKIPMNGGSHQTSRNQPNNGNTVKFKIWRALSCIAQLSEEFRLATEPKPANAMRP